MFLQPPVAVFSTTNSPSIHPSNPPSQIVAKLRADVKAKEDALVEYQQKHGIRIRDGPPPAQAAPAAPAAAAAKGEGVLV